MKTSAGRFTISKHVHRGPRDAQGNRKMYRVTAEVQLTIDAEAIANTLGDKAMRSKAGRSKALYGALEVRIVKESSEVCS